MHRWSRAWTTGACALAVVSGLAGCERGGGRADAGAEADTAVQPTALDPALASRLPPGVSFQMAEQGRSLFTVCSVCHGRDGGGTQLGPSLRDQEWLHGEGTMEQIVEVVRNGVSEPVEYPVPMPVMGGGDFTDEQLQALAAYVYLLGQGA